MYSMEIVQMVSPIRKIRKASELFRVGSERAVVGQRYLIVKPDINTLSEKAHIDRAWSEGFVKEWTEVCNRLKPVFCHG